MPENTRIRLSFAELSELQGDLEQVRVIFAAGENMAKRVGDAGYFQASMVSSQSFCNHSYFHSIYEIPVLSGPPINLLQYVQILPLPPPSHPFSPPSSGHFRQAFLCNVVLITSIFSFSSASLSTSSSFLHQHFEKYT
jgi:hypothetical protein